MQELAIIDFETTGTAAGYDRPTELAIAILRGTTVVDSFSQLMNPGMPIPANVQALTGITNAMVARAPSVARVMREAALFVGQRPLVAHNAAFDSRFWAVELGQLGITRDNPFLCTLRLARRVYPELQSHALQALRLALNLGSHGPAHRAQADVDVTVALLKRIQSDLAERAGRPSVDADFLHRVQQAPRARLAAVLGGEGLGA
jgi:DNA polymerase-3 subunit epsilon